MSKNTPPDDQELWENFVKNIKKIKRDKVITELPKRLFIDKKFALPVPTIKKTQKVGVLHANELNNIKIDAKLDLHGFTQSSAENAIREFLKSAQYKNLRWVCIITGKGSLNNPSILREKAPAWLKELPQYVTGYSHAKSDDGGTGALYVKIRKRFK